MKDEIEVKFINVDHDKVRESLKNAGAKLLQPMRLMKRTILEYPDERLAKDHAWLRVRDEGDKITLTLKQDYGQDFGSAKELETEVTSFKDTVEIFKKLGLFEQSQQESKRETWEIGEVHIELDLWPWLHPYIEIEGPDKESVKAVAAQLGFNWEDAVFGSVTKIYSIQYPSTKNKEIRMVSELPIIKFGDPVPKWLTEE